MSHVGHPVQDVRHAYAVLGLPQGTSASEVRRRYLLLAKRWHPDRFAGDALALTAAEERMRSFNAAYATLVVTFGRPGTRQPPAARAPGQPLSRGEVDRIVASQNTPGPIDSLLNSVGWVGSGLSAGLGGLLLATFACRSVYLLATGQYAQVLQAVKGEPRMVIVLLLLTYVGVHELVSRAQLKAHEAAMQVTRPKGRLTTG
jgi:hypothetical protein